MIKKILGLSFSFTVLMLVGCSSSSENVKRDLFAPPVDKKFDLNGHLETKETIKDAAGIPTLAPLEGININPSDIQPEKLYSVSAINVPVEDILFTLASDAGKQLDLSTSVRGAITINAINQPLELILKRLVEQVNGIFEIEYGTIRILPDQAFWKSYNIDYVNIVKNIEDNTVMKMSVGTVTGSSSAGRAENSEFRLKSKATHDFWNTLKENVSMMASLEVSSTTTTVTQPTGSTSSSQGSAGSTVTESQELNNIVLNKEAGIITVFTTAKKHQQVQRYIDRTLSRTNKQVLIEATVVEVELSDQYQAGVDWSATNTSGSGSNSFTQRLLGTNLSSDPNFSINVSSVGPWNFNLGIKMLQQFGDAKVLSSPKIMAMNNQAALLKVVDNQVYFTVNVDREAATATSAGVITYETTVNTVPVGFMMHVTPFISENDEVSLNIRPTLSRIVGYANDPNPVLAEEGVVSQVPIIQEREMDSVLRLRNKQTAVIGGLIQDSKSDEKTGVPWLSSIPLLGDLFSYRDDSVKKSELIIFIRPVIVSNPDIDHGDLQSLKPYLRTKSN